MSSPPISQPQMLAAINALHEAEEARQPIAARVAAVATALGLAPVASDPLPSDLVLQLEQLVDRLQARLDGAVDVAGDQDAIAQARALLSRTPRSS